RLLLRFDAATERGHEASEPLQLRLDVLDHVQNVFRHRFSMGRPLPRRAENAKTDRARPGRWLPTQSCGGRARNQRFFSVDGRPCGSPTKDLMCVRVRSRTRDLDHPAASAPRGRSARLLVDVAVAPAAGVWLAAA